MSGAEGCGSVPGMIVPGGMAFLSTSMSPLGVLIVTRSGSYTGPMGLGVASTLSPVVGDCRKRRPGSGSVKTSHWDMGTSWGVLPGRRVPLNAFWTDGSTVCCGSAIANISILGTIRGYLVPRHDCGIPLRRGGRRLAWG